MTLNMHDPDRRTTTGRERAIGSGVGARRVRILSMAISVISREKSTAYVLWWCAARISLIAKFRVQRNNKRNTRIVL